MVSVEEHIYYKGSGDDVEIECTFESNPPVLVIWMLNGEDLNLEQRANIQDGTNKGDNAFEVGHYLDIKDLRQEDFGQYTCKGGNSKGQAEAIITISGENKVFSAGHYTWYTARQVVHRWYTGSTQVVHRWYTGGTQVVHR